MEEQCLVKASLSQDVIQTLEQLCPTLPFMPIVRDTHPLHEQLLSADINYVGAEVLFESEDAEVASAEFIEKMHKDKKVVWVNSIIYDYKEQLCAGHSDDTALCVSQDEGWGWLAKRGFDLIQTDWTQMLLTYLNKNELLYKTK